MQIPAILTLASLVLNASCDLPDFSKLTNSAHKTCYYPLDSEHCLVNLLLLARSVFPSKKDLCKELKTSINCLEQVCPEEDNSGKKKDIDFLRQLHNNDCNKKGKKECLEANYAKMTECFSIMSVLKDAEYDIDKIEKDGFNCGELVATVECLEQIIEFCDGEDGLDDYELKEDFEYMKQLSSNCIREEEEIAKCIKANEVSIHRCQFKQMMSALSELDEDDYGYENNNHVQCLWYQVITRCTVEIILENCGPKAAISALEDVNKGTERLQKACDAQNSDFDD